MKTLKDTLALATKTAKELGWSGIVHVYASTDGSLLDQHDKINVD